MNLNPLKKLCGPAHFFLIVCLLFLVLSYIQNIGNSNVYCLGSLSCNVSSVTIIFAIQLIYILFWTWILNLMCNTGVEKLAWVIVLFPFIIMFLAIVSLMYNN